MVSPDTTYSAVKSTDLLNDESYNKEYFNYRKSMYI